MLLFYRIALLLAGLTSTTVAVFFLWGLSDGTIGSSNLLIWLMLVAMTVTLLVFAFRLRRIGQLQAAALVLVVLALPAIIGIAFILYGMIAQPRWN